MIASKCLLIVGMITSAKEICQKWFCLPCSEESTLKGKKLISEEKNLSFKIRLHFPVSLIIQQSTQEVTKVVSLRENGRKSTKFIHSCWKEHLIFHMYSLSKTPMKFKMNITSMKTDTITELDGSTEWVPAHHIKTRMGLWYTSTDFTKGNSFYNFLFTFPQSLALQKRGLLYKGKICSKMNEFFPLRVNHCWQGRQKHFWQSYPPCNYLYIHPLNIKKCTSVDNDPYIR